jgi:hypothetical protein
MVKCSLLSLIFVTIVIVLGATCRPLLPLCDFLLEGMIFPIFRINSFPLHNPFIAILLVLGDVIIYALVFKAIIILTQWVRRRAG